MLAHGSSDVLRDGLAQTGDPGLARRAASQACAIWAMPRCSRWSRRSRWRALAAGVLASVAQVRPRLTPSALKPQFKRLDPRSGLKRLFGVNAAGRGAARRSSRRPWSARSAFLAIWPQLQRAGALVGLPPAAMLAELGRRSSAASRSRVVRRAARARRRRLRLAALPAREELQMTKEEVKQEARQSRPRARGARRDPPPAVRSSARKRMMAEVATADVVVTNPTHFAVALRYDGTTPGARGGRQGRRPGGGGDPRGAAEHGVPVLSEPAAGAGALPRGRARPDDPRGASSPPSPRCSRSSTAPRAPPARARRRRTPRRCSSSSAATRPADQTRPELRSDVPSRRAVPPRPPAGSAGPLPAARELRRGRRRCRAAEAQRPAGRGRASSSSS